MVLMSFTGKPVITGALAAPSAGFLIGIPIVLAGSALCAAVVSILA